MNVEKTNIMRNSSKEYDGPKTTGECGILQLVQLHHKTKSGLPWKKKYSTRRRLFSPTNWT